MLEERVVAILTGNVERKSIIDAVAKLDVPDCWIAGGFVRNPVWDALFEVKEDTPMNDVDVVYFKPLNSYGIPQESIIALLQCGEPNSIWAEEERLQKELEAQFPGLEFEVKNQARMYLSPVKTVKDPPYVSLSDAVAAWVETATATGIRSIGNGKYEVLAPYGLQDLFAGVIRPTRAIFEERARERMEQKRWRTLWPKLRFESANDSA